MGNREAYKNEPEDDVELPGGYMPSSEEVSSSGDEQWLAWYPIVM